MTSEKIRSFLWKESIFGSIERKFDCGNWNFPSREGVCCLSISTVSLVLSLLSIPLFISTCIFLLLFLSLQRLFFYFETINTKVAKQQTDFAAMVSICVPRTKNATSCCQKMAQHTFILRTVSTKILLMAHMIFSRCDFPFDQYLLPFSYRVELVSLQIAVQYCKPSSFCVSSVP